MMQKNPKSGGSEADSKVTSFEGKFLLLLTEDALEEEAEGVTSFSKDNELIDSSSGSRDLVAEFDDILLKLSKSYLVLCIIG